MDGFHGSAVPDGEIRAEFIRARVRGRTRKSIGFLPVFVSCWWGSMVVRFVCVVCVPLCVRVFRVSRVCPGYPRCLFTGKKTHRGAGTLVTAPARYPAHGVNVCV